MSLSLAAEEKYRMAVDRLESTRTPKLALSLGSLATGFGLFFHGYTEDIFLELVVALPIILSSAVWSCRIEIQFRRDRARAYKDAKDTDIGAGIAFV